MITKPIGLYLHIPFCKKKCNYCDFCSKPPVDGQAMDVYVDALLKELDSYKDRKITLDTIFIGGGTPSLLSVDGIERIVLKIRECFAVCDDVEFTVEANPGTLSKEKLCAYRRLGINRLSLGLQSIHENELKKLGRIHNYDEFLESYRLARQVGFDNINVDLMYAIPEQTLDSFLETVDRILELSPEHISLYGLIIEEGTRFFEEFHSLSLPGEDAECDMYSLACKKLAERGYTHYEISNYSSVGRECRHNLKYWHCQEYVGVGLSAHSYFDKVRYFNTDKLDDYLLSPNGLRSVDEAVGEVEAAYERIMLGLRLSEGISLADYKDSFGVDFLLGREKKIEELVSSGLALLSDGRFALSERGFYLSNAIINELT